MMLGRLTPIYFMRKIFLNFFRSKIKFRHSCRNNIDGENPMIRGNGYDSDAKGNMWTLKTAEHTA